VDGPKQTHEDFQQTLALLDDPGVIDEIASIVLAIDPNFDVDGYLAWLKADGGQNLWDMSYAAGQRDSSFTMSVDFDEYIPHQHALTLGYINGSWGHVDLSPEPNDANLPRYPHGTSVTLTAVPNEGKLFNYWQVHDPNHPDDANFAATYTNNPITIVMDRDQQVTVMFKCGNGTASGLPPLVIGMTLIGLASGRRRRRR
jgi:hypothetical protein